jgi:16S rRNA (guanine527-N7)-methyltransferase
LLPLAARHLRPGGRCLFLKGSRVAEELTAAQDSWSISPAQYPSLADPSGVLLDIDALSPGAARSP